VGVHTGIFCGVPYPNPPKKPETVELAGKRMALRWPQGKVDEPAFKRFREQIEIKFHKQAFKIMPPQNRQDFTVWAEAADAVGPAKIEMANEWLESVDDPPQVTFLNHSAVMDALMTEECFPEGWVFTLPDDSIPNPLWKALLVDHIAKNPDALVIYCDHDFLQDGKRVGPDFKPESLDLHQLLCRDYVSSSRSAPRSNSVPSSGRNSIPNYIGWSSM
jgi:hypothetical protein